MPRVEVHAEAGDRTHALQSAIDGAAANGGGTVVLLAGRHQCGPLRLRGGVILEISRNAVLVLTADYGRLAGNSVSVVAENSDRALIVAQGERGIAIRGEGEIVAPGRAYIAGEDATVGTYIPAALRPRVLVIEDCEDVELTGIRISDSPMWTCHLVACAQVQIGGIRIENDLRLPNTDGIVIDGCRDVRIEDASISTADDGICLKTTIRQAGIGRISDVTVRRCRVQSRSCALKIGTETFGDIANVVFEDCTVVDSNRALGIFSRDGGAISEVRFSRIGVECRETPLGFWGSGEALTVTVLDRRPERPAGTVTRVVVEDVTGEMEGAICLIAEKPSGIRDLRLERIDLVQVAGPLGTAGHYDLRPTPADLAPAPRSRGRANAWVMDQDGRVAGLLAYPSGLPGLFARGVTGLELHAVDVERPDPLPPGWAAEPIDIG